MAFKVLFVYPNIQMRTMAPTGIAVLSAVLKDHGFDCDVFDCTLYERDFDVARGGDHDSSHEKFLRMNIHTDRILNSNVLPFDWKSRNIERKESDMGEDFKRKVESFGPDLIAVSLVENLFSLGMDLLTLIPGDIPVVCGGVFPTYAPERVIAVPEVDYVCRGEGEYPLLELCRALRGGRPTDGIPNIWAKDRTGRVTRNGLRAAVDLDSLPFPDFGIFEEALLYTPMQGLVRRTVGFETQRGCPYTCTYCNSPSNNATYSSEGAGKFYRRKSVKRLAREMDHFVKNYGPEFIYFVADTFLAMNEKELDEFSEFYQSYKLPFWMNTRAETVTPHAAEQLAKMNCLRFNIGIEHGNEEFRRNVLKRSMSNDRIVDAFKIAARYSDTYTAVANSIIGLPLETPQLAFDTIEINRLLPDETFTGGAFIFVPYHGTPLRLTSIEKGYIDRDLVCTEASNTTSRSLLNMPGFSDEEIQGLMKTFSFYVKFPRERWPEIDSARKDTPEGRSAFERLRQEYQETYLARTLISASIGGDLKNDHGTDGSFRSMPSPVIRPGVLGAQSGGQDQSP